jgi:hypothetical protein
MKKQTTIICRIGKVLQDQSKDLIHEPLPERWVELLARLNEIELLQSKASVRNERVPKLTDHHGQD